MFMTDYMLGDKQLKTLTKKKPFEIEFENGNAQIPNILVNSS
jgi:hypothetical protein